MQNPKNQKNPPKIRAYVDGWKIYIDQESVRDYTGKGIFYSTRFGISNAIPLGILKEDPFVSAVNINGKNYLRIAVLPLDQDGEVDIEIQKTFLRLATTSPDKLTLKLRSYTYPSDIARVLSEIPLPQDTLRKLHEQAELFEIFAGRVPTYVYKDDLIQAFYYRSLAVPRGVTALSSNLFDSDVENLGLILQFHELAHGLEGTNKLLFGNSNKTLEDAYRRLEDSNILTPVLKKAELLQEFPGISHFRIFDESEYLYPGSLDIRKLFTGHPYDNYKELFASALTIFRYFPDRFIRAYEHLTDQGKQVVAVAKDAVLDIVERRSPNRAATLTLLPEYERLRDLNPKPKKFERFEALSAA